MEQYIPKAAVVAEINRVLNSYDPNEITSGRYALVDLRDFLDTLEVKEVCSDDIRLIPLTPEILEKNGFNLLRDAYGISDPFWSYSNRNVLVDITIIRTNNVKVIDWFNVRISTRNDIKQISFDGVKYVHELQQALRLCGIEKEIKL